MHGELKATIDARRQGLINARNKKLETLVNAAAGPAVPQPHTRTSCLDRINLREEACLGGADEAALLGSNGPGPGPPGMDLGGGLAGITEDGGEGARAAAKPLRLGFSERVTGGGGGASLPRLLEFGHGRQTARLCAILYGMAQQLL
jgi:hypothetical protein